MTDVSKPTSVTLLTDADLHEMAKELVLHHRVGFPAEPTFVADMLLLRAAGIDSLRRDEWNDNVKLALQAMRDMLPAEVTPPNIVEFVFLERERVEQELAAFAEQSRWPC